MIDGQETPNPNPKDSKEDKAKLDVTVRSINSNDVEALRPILETWIRDRNTHELIPEEINGVLRRARDAAEEKGISKYFVAQTADGKIAGMIGLQPVESSMAHMATTEQPIEMVNFFVDEELRDSGVGTALFNLAGGEALQANFSEIIWNSGPRYEKTAWEYYTHKFGDPIGELNDFYGPGGDAPVWHHVLIRP